MQKKSQLVTFVLVISVMIIGYSSHISSTSPSSQDVQTATGLYLHAFAHNTVPYYIRSKNQTPYGLYSAEAHTTYLVYPAGIIQQNGKAISKTAATITAFDHNDHTWATPVEITPEQSTNDAHNVPQVLIDKTGDLHVFHVAHANPAGIVHVRSALPYQINQWDPVSTIPDTVGGGYLAAYQARNGTMYLMYRARLDQNHQPQALCTHCYEPEYILKSNDQGTTWTQQALIDPIDGPDGWNTVYTKALMYDAERDGLHIVFGVHQNHNERMNRHYYIFFSFADDHIFAADGTDFGTTIEEGEYETHAQLFNFNADRGVESDHHVQTSIALYLDGQRHPVVMYSYCDGKCHKPTYIKQRTWTGVAWDDQSLTKQMPGVGAILAINSQQPHNIDLYVKLHAAGPQHPTVIYHFNGEQWRHIGRLFASNQSAENRSVRNMSFIQNYHPELQATLVVPQYENAQANAGAMYSAPYAIGTHYALGILNSFNVAY